jgi:hypothetical protein
MRPVLCITTSKTKKACGVFTPGLLKSGLRNRTISNPALQELKSIHSFRRLVFNFPASLL